MGVIWVTDAICAIDEEEDYRNICCLPTGVAEQSKIFGGIGKIFES